MLIICSQSQGGKRGKLLSGECPAGWNSQASCVQQTTRREERKEARREAGRSLITRNSQLGPLF